jgi:arylsulfatase A-like enzyme
MVTALDEAIGNVTKILYETNLTNTLLLFTSDNGGEQSCSAAGCGHQHACSVESG